MLFDIDIFYMDIQIAVFFFTDQYSGFGSRIISLMVYGLDAFEVGSIRINWFVNGERWLGINLGNTYPFLGVKVYASVFQAFHPKITPIQ